MKKYTLLFLALYSVNCFSQSEKLPAVLVNFENDLRGEMLELTKWGKSEKIYTLNDSEAKEPAVVIDETRADFLEIPKIDDKNTQVFNYRMYYKRIHLNEDKGVESFNKIYLAVRSQIDLVDLRAHTISAKGKISKEFDEKDMKLIEENGNRYLILAIDGAEKGGEVEYFYVTRRSMSEYSDIKIQGSTYIRNYKYTMRVPKHVEYLFKSYNNCPEVTDETKGDYNIYNLDVKNIPVLNKETFQSYNAELMRLEYIFAYTKNKGRVRYNTFADFSKNVIKNMMADQKKSLGEIKKLSKKLKLDELTSEEAKIKTIENWVKTNIAYSDDASFTTMKDLVKNKFANIYGLNRLYAFMFEYNSIKYQLWVSIDKDDKVFDEELESYNFLDNFYFYFPGCKKYLEYKNLGWRLGMPPSAILGQKALQIKIIDLGDGVTSSSYSVGTAETPSCTQTNEILKMDVKLDASMNKAIIKYHAEEAGYQNYIKAAYSVVNDEVKRKELLEEHIKRMSPDAVITKTELKNENIDDIEKSDKPTIIEAEFTASKIIESANDKTILKVGDLIGRQSELYSDKPRQTKIINSFPHMYTRTIAIHIPTGYNTKGLEKLVINKVYQNKNGENTDSIGFISNYKLDGDILTINCIEYYDCLSWPKAQYEEYRTVINSAADFNKFTVILDPKR